METSVIHTLLICPSNLTECAQEGCLVFTVTLIGLTVLSRRSIPHVRGGVIGMTRVFLSIL